ncbi:MAG: hypothetical protein ACTJGR_07730 [Pauljensenia sp.]
MDIPDSVPHGWGSGAPIRVSSLEWPPMRWVPCRTAEEVRAVLGTFLTLDELLLFRLSTEDRGHYVYREPTDGMLYVEHRASPATRSRNCPVVAIARPARATEELVLPRTVMARRFRETSDFWLTDDEVADLFTTLASTGSYPSGFRIGAPVVFALPGSRA